MTELSTMGETAVENRNIQVVTLEIKTLHAQAQQVILGYAVEIGRRLVEAKEMLEHGQWGAWLKEEVAFSKSSANNFMKIYQEYGEEQTSLFGAEVKSQTLGDLHYTKALKLLALPEEERENFAVEHNVAEMSTRELEKAIKEREQAQVEAEKAISEKNRLEQEVVSAEEKVKELEEHLENLRSTPTPVEVIVEKAVDQEAIYAAVAEEEKILLAQIEALETEKTLAHSQLKERLMALERLEADKDELEAMLKMSNEDASLQIARLEQQIADFSASSDTENSTELATFKVHFLQAQEHLNKMVELTEDLKTHQENETAMKLCKALESVLETTLSIIKD